MNLTDTIIAGLLLAVVSGLTLVAYRHPEGYRKISRILLALGGMYFVFRVAGDLGAINANIGFVAEQSNNKPLSAELLSAAAARLVSDYRDLKWTLGVAAVVAVYLMFLAFLPEILEMKSKSVTENGPERESEAEPNNTQPAEDSAEPKSD